MDDSENGIKVRRASEESIGADAGRTGGDRTDNQQLSSEELADLFDSSEKEEGPQRGRINQERRDKRLDEVASAKDTLRRQRVWAAPIPPLMSLRNALLLSLIELGILAGGYWFLGRLQGIDRLAYVAVMAVPLVAVNFVPLLSTDIARRMNGTRHALVEAALYMVLIAGFYVWQFGLTDVLPFAYAAMIILLLEIGGAISADQVNRVSDGVVQRDSSSLLRRQVDGLRRRFGGESLLYVSVPAGLIVATLFGLPQNWTPQDAIGLAIRVSLALAGTVLLGFLVRGCAHMSDPMYRRPDPVDKAPMPMTFTPGEGRGESGLAECATTNAATTCDGREDVSQEETDYVLADMITDIRTAYFFNASHNVVLFGVCVLILASLRNIQIGIVYAVAALCVFHLAFAQLPYGIGQSALVLRILEEYDGITRLNVKERLEKLAPLAPPGNLIRGLLLTGTGGGVLYLLGVELLKLAMK